MLTWQDVSFVDPLTLRPLVPGRDGSGGDCLLGPAGDGYPVVCGIPRLVPGCDARQSATGQSFGFKWSRTESYNSPEMMTETTRWYLAKYGFASLADWADCFQGRRTLDIGCGSAFSSKLWLDAIRWDDRSTYIGVDISPAVEIAQKRLSGLSHVVLAQADALRLPFADGQFERVFSEGVFHHTPSTQQAIASASRVLCDGGMAFFYVYKKKAPMREWTDDYIRERISGLSDEDSWAEMRSLTLLGKALAETESEIVLEQSVPLLGLPGGRFNLQRFFYNHFAKTFWNPKLAFEENVHINFDWYRPAYCHRQTPEQVDAWCREAGLVPERLHVDDSGITVVARRLPR